MKIFRIYIILFFLFFFDLIINAETSSTLDTISGNWTYKRLLQSANFSSVSIVDSNVAWLAGGSGVVYRTVDGGKTFQPRFLNTGEDINCIKAIDSLTCFLGLSNTLKIYKTTNGGLNWTIKYSSFFGAINSIHFFSSDTAIAVGDPYQNKWTILRTTNAGEVWTPISNLIDSSGNIGWANSVTWFQNIGLIGTKNNFIFKTTDRGNNWQKINILDSLTYSIVLFNNTFAISGHAVGKIYRSYNGGNNWISIIFPDSNDIGGIALIDTLNIWINSGNKIYSTFNTSSQWKNELTSPYKLTHIHMKREGNLIFGYSVGKLGSVGIYKYRLLPEIKLTAPIGGENLLTNSNYLIKWKSQLIDKVKLELSTNEGNTWTLIKDSVSASASQFLWTVPNSPSNFCRIKISSVANPLIADTLKVNFSIVSASDIDWQTTIQFSDSLQNTLNLTFGQAPSATDSIDSNLGEAALQPPLANQFDVRFSLPISNSLQSIKDFRNDKLKTIIWKINLQANGNNYPIKLSWNKNSLSPAGIITLKDTITGNIINLNLRNDSTFAITDTNIKILIIEKVPPPVRWTTDISVRDNNINSTFRTLTFGVANSATDSIDEFYYEKKLPPPPPFGNFDARFILPNMNDASIIDYRGVKSKIIWTLQFQPGTSGYPILFKWDPKKLPAGIFLLKDPLNSGAINVNMKTDSSFLLTNTGIIQLKIEHINSQCLSINVDSNWNIVGVPVIKDTMTKLALFPTSSSFAFSFDNGYKIVDTLKIGAGYWLKFNSQQSVNICGLIIDQKYIQLKEGWNLISPFDSSISVNNLITIPENILSSNFFEYNKGYLIANTLKTGKGYWIKSSQAGQLIFPLIFNKQINITENKNYPALSFTDKNSNNTTLFFDKDAALSIKSELPPKPPADIFDIRFATDKYIEDPEKQNIVQLNSVTFPIKLKALNTDFIINDNINGELLNLYLKNSEELIIENNKLTSLKITVNNKKYSFKLYQNYPNPFNPTTTIKYDIPHLSANDNVSLKIYDILGRHIQTLVNQPQKSGSYSIEWNASEFPSGIYFYELSYGNYRDLKKMILVK